MLYNCPRVEATLAGHTSSVNALVGLENGLLASASLDKSIKVWNVRDGRLVKSFGEHSGGVHSMVLISKGRLASGGGFSDKQIKIWSPSEGGLVKTVENVHKDAVLSLAFVDGGCLASGSKDKTINLWNVNE